jgi:hypothetical protein
MEGMEKQTAVDWLVDKLKENGVDFWQEEIEIIKEAKEMEKEQMLEVSKAGCFGTFEFEDYYNENYKSE